MHILKKSPSGFTLVELMVVVAIVGVLAAMGSVGYTRYIKTAQLEELEQIALEVASGQQRFRSRQNAFYPLSAGEKNWLVAADKKQIIALLEVRSQLPPNVRLRILSWEKGGTATCASFCNGLGDNTTAGFLVGVQRDFDGTVENNDPLVVVSNNMRPVRFHEGEK